MLSPTHAVRSVTYFHGNGIGQPLLALAIWSVTTMTTMTTMTAMTAMTAMRAVRAVRVSFDGGIHPAS